MSAKILLLILSLVSLPAFADLKSDVQTRFPLEDGEYELSRGSLDCWHGTLQIFEVEGGLSYKLGDQTLATGVALHSVTDTGPDYKTTHMTQFDQRSMRYSQVSTVGSETVRFSVLVTLTADGFNYERIVHQPGQPTVDTKCQLIRSN